MTQLIGISQQLNTPTQGQRQNKEAVEFAE